MFLKHKLSFSVLIICFVSSNLASPAARSVHDVSDGSSTFTDVAGSVQELTSEIEKSLKHLTQNSGWIYNNLVTIFRTSLEQGLENVMTWVLDIVTRNELLVMADGSHMMFPLSRKSENEREYKTIAIAVSKLLMNLKTMERTDEVLKNVTRNLVTQTAKPHVKEYKEAPEKTLRTFLHEYFETLDQHMRADEVLTAEYQKVMTEARGVVNRHPEMREPLFKIWESQLDMPGVGSVKKFLENKRVFRQAYANKLFMKQAVKHFTMIFSATHKNRYFLARALIQKAGSSTGDSKINELYHQALVGAAEIALGDDDKISETLFNSIDNALESESTLNTEIRNIMEEIEGNTVYDTDMLHIDFSIV